MSANMWAGECHRYKDYRDEDEDAREPKVHCSGRVIGKDHQLGIAMPNFWLYSMQE